MFESSYLIVRYMPYLLIVWFVFIALFGGSKSRPHSVLLFALFLVRVIIFKENDYDYYSIEYRIEYLIENRQLLRLDGCFAMAMVMFISRDKKAKILSFLLCCAVSVHFMLIYDLQEESSWLSSFTYDYCDELIIIIWLTMMVIAKDGLITAFNSVSLLLRGNHVYCIRNSKNSLREQKDQKSP